MIDHERYAHLFESYLAFLEGAQDEPDLTTLASDVRERLIREFEILRHDHGLLSELPDLADDPVFTALGFDRVGTDIEVDGKKVRAARQRSKLDYKEIALRMKNAGSLLGVRDLFRIEQQTATPLPQVDVTALVAALRVSLADLESSSAQVSRMRQFLASGVFDTVIRRWCEETGADLDRSAARARKDLLTTNFRGGDHTDFADLADLLRALLESWSDGDAQEPR